MTTDGKEAKKIAQGQQPVFSPDGEKVYFLSLRGGLEMALISKGQVHTVWGASSYDLSN